LFFNYGKKSGFYYGILLDFEALNGLGVITVSRIPNFKALFKVFVILLLNLASIVAYDRNIMSKSLIKEYEEVEVNKLFIKIIRGGIK